MSKQERHVQGSENALALMFCFLFKISGRWFERCHQSLAAPDFSKLRRLEAAVNNRSFQMGVRSFLFSLIGTSQRAPHNECLPATYPRSHTPGAAIEGLANPFSPTTTQHPRCPKLPSPKRRLLPCLMKFAGVSGAWDGMQASSRATVDSSVRTSTSHAQEQSEVGAPLISLGLREAATGSHPRRPRREVCAMSPNSKAHMSDSEEPSAPTGTIPDNIPRFRILCGSSPEKSLLAVKPWSILKRRTR